MILVRNRFIAKPGHASKLAYQLTDAAATIEGLRFRVLTDLTGDFNAVILEFEVASISEFEDRHKEYMTDGPFREKMQGYTEHWQTGHRELLQIL